MDAIGGYFGLEEYSMPMMYENAIKLNYGRYCLEYIIKARNIKKMYIPRYMCASIKDILVKNNIEYVYYDVDINFWPCDLNIQDNEWLYLVNYYGQLSNDDIVFIKNKYNVEMIVDNVQSFFQEPIDGIDTIYSCRKYFGVPDGAFLVSDIKDDMKLEIDDSMGRMEFVLGRFNSDSETYYNNYLLYEESAQKVGLKRMSKITYNLLHSIDYDYIKTKRETNYKFLYDAFKNINILKLSSERVTFMYPLYLENGESIKKRLIENRIYIPTLWGDVYKISGPTDLCYKMTRDVVMLPIDQRYDICTMKKIIELIKY